MTRENNDAVRKLALVVARFQVQHDQYFSSFHCFPEFTSL